MEPGAEANNNVALVYAWQGHEAHRRVEESHWLSDTRRKSFKDEAQNMFSPSFLIANQDKGDSNYRHYYCWDKHS